MPAPSLEGVLVHADDVGGLTEMGDSVGRDADETRTARHRRIPRVVDDIVQLRWIQPTDVGALRLDGRLQVREEQSGVRRHDLPRATRRVTVTHVVRFGRELEPTVESLRGPDRLVT